VDDAFECGLTDGHVEVVHLLLDSGANVAVADHEEMGTPGSHLRPGEPGFTLYLCSPALEYCHAVCITNHHPMALLATASMTALCQSVVSK